MGPRVRTGDHESSLDGARYIETKAPTQKQKLLAAFKAAGIEGLTDEQAADLVDLSHTCFWKRCGELRADGSIGYTGDLRKGKSGVKRLVSMAVDE